MKKRFLYKKNKETNGIENQVNAIVYVNKQQLLNENQLKQIKEKEVNHDYLMINDKERLKSTQIEKNILTLIEN